MINCVYYILDLFAKFLMSSISCADFRYPLFTTLIIASPTSCSDNVFEGKMRGYNQISGQKNVLTFF